MNCRFPHTGSSEINGLCDALAGIRPITELEHQNDLLPPASPAPAFRLAQILCPADFQYDCLPFYVAQLSERLPKRLEEVLARREGALKAQATRGIFGVCPEVASDHSTAAPPKNVMKSRRLTRPPDLRECQSIRWHSGKAIAAPQSAEVRDVSCGSDPDQNALFFPARRQLHSVS